MFKGFKKRRRIYECDEIRVYYNSATGYAEVIKNEGEAYVIWNNLYIDKDLGAGEALDIIIESNEYNSLVE